MAQRVAELAAPPTQPLSDEAIFPFELHREMTMILAGIVLQGRHEANA